MRNAPPRHSVLSARFAIGDELRCIASRFSRLSSRLGAPDEGLDEGASAYGGEGPELSKGG